MHLRQMTTAFIFNNDKVLMMKRNSNRFFNFEFWSGVGGHIEPNEINDPQKACLREIFEESELQQHEIQDFTLRYILVRLKEDEIRQQYVYFGRTDKTEIVSSDEGELFWVRKGEVTDLHVSTIIRFMFEDYIKETNKDVVKIGTITTGDDEEPFLQWAYLKDPKIF